MRGTTGYAHVAEGRMWVRMERAWVPPAERRARISEREQVGPLRSREWDDGDLSYDLSYDDGWCDEPECPVCASVEIRTPRLTCPLLARAAML